MAKGKLDDTMLLAPSRKRNIFNQKDEKEFHLLCAINQKVKTDR